MALSSKTTQELNEEYSENAHLMLECKAITNAKESLSLQKFNHDIVFISPPSIKHVVITMFTEVFICLATLTCHLKAFPFFAEV